jgi:SAM-dependent methyltransferase
MKLNELVNLRNELQKAMDLSVIQLELEKNSQRLRNLKNGSDPEYAAILEQIAASHDTVINHATQDLGRIQETIDSINEDINSIAGKFFNESYQLELRYVDPESIRSVRTMGDVDPVINLLLSRIQLHSSWQYPALEIGCRDGEWTRHLVASDPLYIADVFDEFLNSAVSQFAPLYQGRIRRYLIRDYQIDALPKNQFGLIFSYNFFNYLSLDSIKQYLNQAMTWLRPGGVMLFTYNNADLPAGAAYAENYFMSYVPKSMLIPLCESVGFEVVTSMDHEPACSWLEIKKAGVLNTVKASQVLGEIIPINN